VDFSDALVVRAISVIHFALRFVLVGERRKNIALIFVLQLEGGGSTI
jgi:hypothetical protein